ncbi:TonB-dependent receptor [Dyella subtropica]|uniref:TonB-dependent receptor n=1 Tax=Dyella subtropica TaxID=2992127 RepID=UPI00225C3120|nr:TonB-dependent receptor [Dyella subtropica]
MSYFAAFTKRPKGRSSLALAVALALASTGALAQSNITGSIFGQVAAQSGNTIEIKNVDTGLTRSTSVDDSGRYRFSSLPTGRYQVTLKNNGANVSTRDNVELSIAAGTEVSFGAASAAADNAKNLDGVSVVASALPAIDVSSVDTRTVLTSEQLAKLPIARDVAAAALLAPGVIANTAYPGAPSFGGSASSENAYFINGYAVTNPLTSISFTQLPFDAIDQQQTLTGGYGAEFGRSTGGVINIVTKRGSNQLKGGVYTIWEPEAGRANPRNNYFPKTGFYGAGSTTPTDGTLYQYNNRNQYWKSTVGAYVSGALVKDRLFFYLNTEMNRQEGASVLSSSNSSAAASNIGYSSYTRKIPRWTGKLDWNITDNHIIELTGVSDKTEVQSDRYSYDYGTLSHGTSKTGSVYTKDGGDLYVGKYTGYITEDLTVSALYGTQKVNHVQVNGGYDPNCPYIQSSTVNQVPGLAYNTCQTAVTSTIPLDGANDKTHGWRLDVEYRIGSHDVRFGYDAQNAKSFTGKKYAGDYAWIYGKQANPNAAANASLNVIGSPASAGGYGTQGYFVTKTYSTTSANIETDQAAQFIEDRWQINDQWLLSVGLRNEQFTNYNKNGEAYIKQRHQLAPRLGASWDVFGDSTLKVYANAGRYHLAVPNSAAARSVSGSILTSQYFTYTGVDQKSGVPTGLNPIAVSPNNPYLCTSTGGVSTNIECGPAPDPRTVAAKNLRAHYQDEYILGMEQQITPSYNWGAKLTYRKLMSAIDDTCVPALGGRCLTFNPGTGNTFNFLQPDGSIVSKHFSKEDLGLPDLKRKYYAVDLFVEHPFADKWYGKVAYTFSRNYGNTEGQLASDLDTGIGGQQDVSRTQDWDLAQLMVGSGGVLPNHRAHQVKAFGYYQLDQEWRFGATVIAASGRPKSCTSYYPTADQGLYNSSTYWFCGLAGSGTAPGTKGYVAPSADYTISPRGSHGTTPWTYQLNLNVAYTPGWMDNKLTLQLDAINVLNRQTPQMYNFRYSLNRTTVNPLYGRELNYTDPRYFRVTARYDF